MPAPDAVEQLRRKVDRELPDVWTQWPGGWIGEIEVALIDAVFSIQANYTGVRRVIERWRGHRGDGRLDDLHHLAAFRSDPSGLVEILHNRQMVPGRSSTKAGAVAEAAQRLLDAGVRTSDQFGGGSDEQRIAYVGVAGLGDVTWAYLGMLLGKPGVKADTMIRRFVSESQNREVTASEAAALVNAVASVMGRSPTDLDHAIWSYQRRHRGVAGAVGHGIGR